MGEPAVPIRIQSLRLRGGTGISLQGGKEEESCQSTKAAARRTNRNHESHLLPTPEDGSPRTPMHIRGLAAARPHSSGRSHSVQQREHEGKCPFGISTCTGCRAVGKSAHLDEGTVSLHRLQFSKMIMALNMTFMVRSPATFRDQLFEKFIGTGHWVRTMPGGYRLLSRLKDWFTPRGKAMAAATDSLLLSQSAHDTADEALRLECNRRYVVAISVLRAALLNPRAAYDEDILFATDALGVWEALGFDDVGSVISQGHNRWLLHGRGLCTLLRARGPHSIKDAPGRYRGIVFNAMYVAINDSMAHRQSLMFGQPDWQRALEAGCHGRMWCFSHIAARFPAFLVRLDALDATVDIAADEASEILSGLLDLQNALKLWLLAWYEDLPELPTRSISVAEYTSFIARLGPLADQIPMALSFPSLVEAFGHLAYWTFSLFVRRAIYDLSMRPEVLHIATPAQRHTFCEDVYDCADSICRSAPFYLLLVESPYGDKQGWQSGGYERDLYGSLFWALQWYTSRGNQLKMEFCRAIVGGHIRDREERQLLPSPHAADGWWIVGKILLFQRLVWQDLLGPSSCALREGQAGCDVHEAVESSQAPGSCGSASETR